MHHEFISEIKLKGLSLGGQGRKAYDISDDLVDKVVENSLSYI